MAKLEHTRGSRRHTQYALNDGTWVPGITTVTSILDKPGLAPAANKLGLQGIDSGVHWKGLATIGSLAHMLIEHQLKGVDSTIALRDYTENEQQSARKSLAKFNAWTAQRDFRFVDSEFQQVSEKHGFGGTGDCLAYVNGSLSYVDFKTGGLFLEAELQGAANAELLNENGRGPIKQFILLGLPRNDEEEFHEKIVDDWRVHFRMFLALLEAYSCRQTLQSVKKGALREIVSNVIPFEDVRLNEQLRASIAAKLAEKGGAPA